MEIYKLSAVKDTWTLTERFVHEEYGVHDVNRIGVPYTFEQYDNISLLFITSRAANRKHNFMAIADSIRHKELILCHMKFDCNEFERGKVGFF